MCVCLCACARALFQAFQVFFGSHDAAYCFPEYFSQILRICVLLVTCLYTSLIVRLYGLPSVCMRAGIIYNIYMCMHVCMYVCMYIYIYREREITYVYACMYVCMYVCIYIKRERER